MELDAERALRRVGVIGDVHAELAALEAALALFSARGVDAVLCVGDIVDGPGTDAEAAECCRRLRDAGVLAISGNHERWWLQGEMRTVPDPTGPLPEDVRAYLAGLPATRRLRTVAGNALLCHGVGDDDLAVLYPETKGYALQAVMPTLVPLMKDPELDYAIGGHTHRRMARAFPGLTFVNAGTLHRAFEVTVTLVDFAAKEVRHVPLEGPPEAPTPGPDEVLPLADPLPLS
ncbi:MAG: metallophosphoesterase family protein [Myxococcota bacterium]